MTKHRVLTALILTILLLMFLQTGFATETRVISLGDIGPSIRDNSNIFYFPATITQYSKQAVAELRSKEYKDEYSIGIHLPISSDAVFGIYLNDPIYLPSELMDIVSNVELENATTLIYGKKMQNFDIGLAMTLSMDSWDSEFGTIKQEESARYLNFTLGMSTPQYDLGAMLDLPAVSAKDGEAETKWSGVGFGFLGRYFMKKTEEIDIVPVAYFNFGSGSYEDDPGISGMEKTEVDNSELDLNLGASLHYHLTNEHLAILGLEAFGLSQEVEEVKEGNKTTESWTTLPGIFIGVESTLKPWLIGRIGASQVYQSYSRKVEPPQGESTESSYSDSYFDLTFGLGIKIGDFLLDASFNENMFFDGPNFISGQVNSIAHRISLTYNF
jgi:hypothetical protein